ncbi:MAG: cytidine/deoxycytidylate deaminase family protein [Candidatus Diapherotrites archaeon]
MSDRISWDNYFMKMAKLASERSTCLRRKVGAVIVREKKVLSTGYNGAPSGVKSCLELGECLREKNNVPSGERHELCRGAHAESNAIAQAAQFGVAVKGGTLYATNFPCSMCTKLLINSGISEIVFADKYPDELSKDLLEQTEIKLRKVG